MKIVQNALFRSCGARFGQIAFFQRQSSQNCETGLQFSSNRKNIALSKKIVQNALFMSCAARFGQIAVSTVKVLKIVTVAWNSFKKGKECAFHKNCTKRSFQVSVARFGQIAFWSVNVLKIVKLASNSFQNRETLRFLWKLYKTLFSGHAQHVLAKSHFWPSMFLKSSQWPEFLSKKRKQCAFL